MQTTRELNLPATQNILLELRRLMNERTPGTQIELTHHLRRDHGFDSLDTFDFLFSVAESFKIAIREEDLKERQLADVANLVAFIQEKTA